MQDPEESITCKINYKKTIGLIICNLTRLELTAEHVAFLHRSGLRRPTGLLQGEESKAEQNKPKVQV